MRERTSVQRCCAELILVVIFFAAFSGRVFAQSKQSIQVAPAFQEFILSNDTASVSGEIQLTNATKDDQVFQVFATDIQQFDADGKIVLADKPLSGKDYSLANFIQLESTQSAVAANQSAAIRFSVRNAPDLQPGGHYSALVVRTAPGAATTNQQVLPAITSFLLVRKVGGERFHISLLPIDIAKKSVLFGVPSNIQLTFSNQGNSHVIPHGVIELTDLFGHTTHRATINENSVFVLPSTQRDIPVTLHRLDWSWPIMIYALNVTGSTNPGDVTFEQHASVVVIDPIVFSLSTIAIIGIAGILLVVKSRLRKRL